MFRAIKKADCA